MIRAALAWCTVLLVALLAPGRALAQGSFQLDSVMVAIPEGTPDRSLADAGASLQGDLERMLASEYFVIPFAKVPDYQDYTAAVYLDSCPEGNYVGCTYVLGSRAKVDWAVALQLSRDAFGDEVLLTIVDVDQSRPVVSFSSKLEANNHGAIAAGLSLVLDSVIRGAHADSDVRGEVVDEREAWERRREEARQAAEGLAFADQDLQILVRPEVGSFDDPRLKPGDLKEWELRDDEAPWVSLGMTKGEYVRYKNSGQALDEWRTGSSGRLHRIMVRLEAGFGAGSYRHVYDGRWVLDDQTLEPVEVVSIRQMEKGPSTAFRLEVAYGVHKWVEVGLGVAARTARFTYYYQREIEGEEVPQLIAEGDTFRYTPEFRVFGGFIPLPNFPVRPTAHLAVAYWMGSPISRVVLVEGPPEDSPAPQFVLLHVIPGVEVSPNRWVTVFVRVTGEILMVGNRAWESHTGEPTLADPAQPNPLKMGGGWQVSFGVTGHFGPFFTPKKRAGFE